MGVIVSISCPDIFAAAVLTEAGPCSALPSPGAALAVPTSVRRGMATRDRTLASKRPRLILHLRKPEHVLLTLAIKCPILHRGS
eukprot:2195517-Pleurochrysis_carterae.AAC.1